MKNQATMPQIFWLRRVLKKLRFYLVIVIRTVCILIRIRQSIRINSFSVHQQFLLFNGHLILSWKIKNFLWIKINNQMITTNRQGILLHFDKLAQPISLTIVGLWSKKTIPLNIQPIARINSNAFPPLQLQALTNNYISYSPLLKSCSISNNNIKTSLAIYPTLYISQCIINIPEFIKDNYNEQTVLPNP